MAPGEDQVQDPQNRSAGKETDGGFDADSPNMELSALRGTEAVGRLRRRLECLRGSDEQSLQCTIPAGYAERSER